MNDESGVGRRGFSVAVLASLAGCASAFRSHEGLRVVGAAAGTSVSPSLDAGGGHVVVARDLDSLRALATEVSCVVLLGRSASGDGGGGLFARVEQASRPDDGALFVRSTASSMFARGWQRLFDGPISVRWFGAKGDGHSDDTQAIQRAIDAATDAVRPRSVHIPAGVYIVRGTIRYERENLTLLGDGISQTILDHDAERAGTDCMVFGRDDDAHYHFRNALRGLTVVGHANTRRTLSCLAQSGFVAESVYLVGGRVALFQHFGVHCRFENGLMRGGREAGIVISNTATTTTTSFVNCYISSNPGDGYRGGETTPVTFQNCIFESNGGCGIRIGSDGDHGSSVVLMACHFESNALAAVRAGHSHPSGVASYSSVYLGRPGEYDMFDVDHVHLVTAGDYVVTCSTIFKTTPRSRVEMLSDPNPVLIPARQALSSMTGSAASTSASGNQGGTIARTLTAACEGTVVVDVRRAEVLAVGPLTGSVTVAAPSGPPNVGQRLTVMFTQGSARAFGVRWDAVFRTRWSDHGAIPGARSTVSFVFDGMNWIETAYTPWFRS